MFKLCIFKISNKLRTIRHLELSFTRSVNFKLTNLT